jgi:hypothetical protein
MKPTQQSHTYLIPTMPPADLKCGKSVSAPRFQKSNFHPSKNFKNSTHNRHKISWTETTKTHTDKGLSMTADRRPACNMRLASCKLTPINRGKLCKLEAFPMNRDKKYLHSVVVLVYSPVYGGINFVLPCLRGAVRLGNPTRTPILELLSLHQADELR